MARRKHHEEHQNHEAWAIPYGDLVTLLLAFFVVMYAMSSVNEGKYRILSDSLNAAFRGTPTSVSPVQVGSQPMGSRADEIMAIVLQTHLQDPPRDLLTTPPVRSESSQSASQSPHFDAGGGGTADKGSQKQLAVVAGTVEQAMADLIDRGMIAVRHKHGAVEVEIRADILFLSAQAQLTPAARDVIERIGDALSVFPNSINVEGHTDDRPISTPAYPSNWELSAARAASVVHLLTQRKIEPIRLQVIGHGEQKPIASNDTVEGRNANRRVLLVIRAMEPEVASILKVVDAR
jgi:chemotaxis protein MotB